LQGLDSVSEIDALVEEGQDGDEADEGHTDHESGRSRGRPLGVPLAVLPSEATGGARDRLNGRAEHDA
jgi:hypothetical protein